MQQVFCIFVTHGIKTVKPKTTIDNVTHTTQEHFGHTIKPQGSLNKKPQNEDGVSGEAIAKLESILYATVDPMTVHRGKLHNYLGNTTVDLF